MKDPLEQDLAQPGSPESAADRDVREAVDDLLEDICQRLSREDIPSIPSAPASQREDWDEDRPTPEIRWAIPPPSPESDSGRVTDPDILSQAIVYAPKEEAPVAGRISIDPRISVTSLLDEIEVDSILERGSDDAPLSLRPTSRTSYPEPERKNRAWMSAIVVVALVACSLVWLSSRLDSAEAAALPPPQAPQGVLAHSKMRGVQLFVDGHDRGPLPAAVLDLDAGKHELRFEAAKYRPLVRSVIIENGGVVDLGSVALEVATEQIRIELTPHNAYLQLLHIESGETQRYAGPWPRVLSLPPGRYDVLAFRGGFRTWAMRLTVQSSHELVTWRIELPTDDIYAD